MVLLLALTDDRYAGLHSLCSAHSPHLRLLIKAPFTLWALYIYIYFYKSFSLHNKTSTVISNMNFLTNKIPWERIVVVQSLSCVQLFATPWTAACQASLSFRERPWVCSNSCLWSIWCHPTISSSGTPFSSCPQSFPASGSFPKSRLFTSGGQSIGASASTSVFPMNIQDWFPLGLTGLISLQSKGLSRVFSSTIVGKYKFFSTQPSLWSNSDTHTWILEKP